MNDVRRGLHSDFIYAVTIPQAKTQYKIDDSFIVNTMSETPNWFHRKMMKLLLGWEVSKISKENK